MFSIGFFELLIIAVMMLLVFGPERLPGAIRTFVYNFAKFKRSWQTARREFEQELGMDEIRREIHNAQIMENLESAKTKTQQQISDLESEVSSAITSGSTLDNTSGAASSNISDNTMSAEMNSTSPQEHTTTATDSATSAATSDIHTKSSFES